VWVVIWAEVVLDQDGVVIAAMQVILNDEIVYDDALSPLL